MLNSTFYLIIFIVFFYDLEVGNYFRMHVFYKMCAFRRLKIENTLENISKELDT